MSDFSAPIFTAVGLVKIELPSGDVRLCDGGFADFDSERYESSHPVFGTIGASEPISEALDDQAPAATMTLLPPDGVAAAELSQPSYQGARVRFWIGVVNPGTGQIAGEPEQLADLILDSCTLVAGRGTRSLEIGLVSHGDRLFAVREGMVLSPQFHKSIWPGETGLDNMTGHEVAVAWGTFGPPRGVISGGSGAGGSGPWGSGGGRRQ
jgi:hypothetical protein